VVLILLESAVVVALFFVWILSETVRESTALAVLFFYSFPAEFLVGLVPHEPILIYFGTFHPPWVVALVAVVSTVMAEAVNYSLFGLFYETTALGAVAEKKAVRKTVDLFGRAPFTAILVAGFTPIPFFPVRFLVVMAPYPLYKYLLGVFISRAPRFYLLALFGEFFEVPGSLLTVLFVAMLAAVNIPALFKILFPGNRRPPSPSS
jgi:membrane protein YqaA with SNARE-associated domain